MMSPIPVTTRPIDGGRLVRWWAAGQGGAAHRCCWNTSTPSSYQNLVMSQDSTIARADDLSKGSAGFTSFVARVLEQLAVSAWLPAAMLTAVGALLVTMHRESTSDVGAAVSIMSSASWTVFIVWAFGLVLATMVTQAFSFGVIRALEGYWASGWALDWATRVRVRHHVRRSEVLHRRVVELHRRLFESARGRLLAEEERDHVDVWETDVYDIPPERQRVSDPATIAAALEIDWREKGDPAVAALFYRAAQRVGDYPTAPHRILPTRMGNVLRASEERLGLEGDRLERFVMDNHLLVPSRLMGQHDQFRDRLEMYSLLVFVFFALACAAGPLLAGVRGHPVSAPITGVALLLALSMLSYRAAIASARGYGTALVAMRDEISAHQTPG